MREKSGGANVVLVPPLLSLECRAARVVPQRALRDELRFLRHASLHESLLDRLDALLVIAGDREHCAAVHFAFGENRFKRLNSAGAFRVCSVAPTEFRRSFFG